MPEGEGQEPSAGELQARTAERLLEEAEKKVVIRHTIESRGVEGVITLLKDSGYSQHDIDDVIMSHEGQDSTVDSYLDETLRMTDGGKIPGLHKMHLSKEQKLELADKNRQEFERAQSMLTAWRNGGDNSELRTMLTDNRKSSLDRLTSRIDEAGSSKTESQKKNPKVAQWEISTVVASLATYMRFDRLLREVNTRYPEQPQTPTEK